MGHRSVLHSFRCCLAALVVLLLTGALPRPAASQGWGSPCPDGTSEYLGYNGADEAAWPVGRDGGLTTLERDALHRVFRVNYPDAPGYPGFSVETQRDVFARVKQVMDGLGTSTAGYDD